MRLAEPRRWILASAYRGAAPTPGVVRLPGPSGGEEVRAAGRDIGLDESDETERESAEPGTSAEADGMAAMAAPTPNAAASTHTRPVTAHRLDRVVGNRVLRREHVGRRPSFGGLVLQTMALISIFHPS